MQLLKDKKYLKVFLLEWKTVLLEQKIKHKESTLTIQYSHKMKEKAKKKFFVKNQIHKTIPKYRRDIIPHQ